MTLESMLLRIDEEAFQLAQQVQQFFTAWKAGEIYIPKAALRAMGRRYLVLRDNDDLTMQELYEFGRLYAFFCLMYPPNGDIVTPGAIAIDFSNLIIERVNTPSPSASVVEIW